MGGCRRRLQLGRPWPMFYIELHRMNVAPFCNRFRLNRSLSQFVYIGYTSLKGQRDEDM
jgi:hypothetical protein